MNELPPRDPGADPAERLLDAALALADHRGGWDAVHLHDAARTAGLTLAEAHRLVRGKDGLADLWFDRADHALLRAGDAAHRADLSARDRLLQAMLAWFGALGGHRAATLAMLRYRLQPDHLHLHLAGVARISRTVQWWREAARLPSAGWRREAEEAALTAIFLGAVDSLALDPSPEAAPHARAGWSAGWARPSRRRAGCPAPAKAPRAGLTRPLPDLAGRAAGCIDPRRPH